MKTKVLVLSRSYPNSVLPLLGLWVQGLVRHASPFCESRVIAPVPYCPPAPGLGEEYTRFRRVEPWRSEDGIPVHHPRFLLFPGYRLHSLEGLSYYAAVRPLTDRLRRDFPFEIIHAHFTYPDGWVAAKLGRRYGVPVVITEHAPWHPWMDDYPLVRRQAVWASRQSAFHIGVSRITQKEIADFTGPAANLRVVPLGIDRSLFKPAPEPNGAGDILFVGIVRRVKGLDTLLHAMRLLAARGCKRRLVVVGDGFYSSYRRDFDNMRQLAQDLGLNGQVVFEGKKQPADLVPYIQKSAVLVLPSRKESLGMVLVEALACGVPVVATRCGGPEDIVTDEVGALIPPEDPEALAQAIETTLASRSRFHPERLRAYALSKFSWETVVQQNVALYRDAIGRAA